MNGFEYGGFPEIYEFVEFAVVEGDVEGVFLLVFEGVEGEGEVGEFAGDEDVLVDVADVEDFEEKEGDLGGGFGGEQGVGGEEVLLEVEEEDEAVGLVGEEGFD